MRIEALIAIHIWIDCSEKNEYRTREDNYHDGDHHYRDHYSKNGFNGTHCIPLPPSPPSPKQIPEIKIYE